MGKWRYSYGHLWSRPYWSTAVWRCYITSSLMNSADCGPLWQNLNPTSVSDCRPILELFVPLFQV